MYGPLHELEMRLIATKLKKLAGPKLGRTTELENHPEYYGGYLSRYNDSSRGMTFQTTE